MQCDIYLLASYSLYIFSEHRTSVCCLPIEVLFGCCQIHLNPHMLKWIEVEFSSSFTLIHTNTLD